MTIHCRSWSLKLIMAPGREGLHLVMPRSTEPPPALAEYPWPVCALRVLAKRALPAAPLLQDKGRRERLQRRDGQYVWRARKKHFRWRPVFPRAIREEQPSAWAAPAAAESPQRPAERARRRSAQPPGARRSSRGSPG